MSGTRNLKKRITAILLGLMLCLSLGACGASQDEGEDAANISKQKPGSIISETETERTIVDQAGREVVISKNPESIALTYRVVTRLLLSLDQGEKIKGMGKTDDFIEAAAPYLSDCVDVGKGVADIEALAELNPDLYFGKASDIEGLEAVADMGIPAIGISIESPEEITEALDVIGKACVAEDKAEQLIEYYDSELEIAKELTSGIKNKDKRTAIVMGSSIGKVADGSMLQSEMLECAGAINAAKDLEASELWPTAGTEQIFAWNPDYIFITNSESTVYKAEDIMKDPAWAELKAVKQKHVYMMPASLDSWEFPGVVSVLGIDFMMHTMYPDLMSDEELEAKVRSLYDLMYGKEFSREELGY